MEDSLKRADLGRVLQRAKLDSNAMVLENLTNHFLKISSYKNPNLVHLNPAIEKTNAKIAKIKAEYDLIRKQAEQRVRDLEVEYFLDGIENVTRYKDGTVGFMIDGFMTVVERFWVDHLYKDGLSGKIRLQINRCSDSYDFQIVAGKLFIKKDTCFY